MGGYVYIIQSLRNGRFYIGSTNDLERRLDDHNCGRSVYTSETGPWIMVFNQKFTDLSIARKVELWLKRQKDADFVRRVITEGQIDKVFG